MSGIFISYRREEDAAYAGRLYDRLVKEFGQRQVFMDVGTIDPGVDFVKAIEEAVAAVDVLLCVMGNEWLATTDESGKRRLDDPMDFVRLEVATALKRDIRVVPVLVGGTTMPSADQLPPDLSTLARRNALELSDARFHSDVDRLIESVRRLMPDSASSSESSSTRSQKEANRPVRWLVAAGVFLLIVGGAWYVWEQQQDALRQQLAAEAEAKRQEEQAQRRAEIEAQRKAKLDAKRKLEAEAKRKADLEAKQEAELKAKREAELEAKRKAAAAKQKAELEAQRKAKLEAQRKAKLTGFRVVEILLRADPFDYDGPCPVKISFSGRISVAGGSGTVAYKFLRNDGASAPVKALTYDGPGSKSVSTAWTLGAATPRFRPYSGWQSIKIFDPEEMESKRASFKIYCR